MCLQTRHLTENYDYWIKILQEQSQQGSGSLESTSSSDGSSTPVLNQELTEIAEETQEDSEEDGSCSELEETEGEIGNNGERSGKRKEKKCVIGKYDKLKDDDTEHDRT